MSSASTMTMLGGRAAFDCGDAATAAAVEDRNPLLEVMLYRKISQLILKSNRWDAEPRKKAFLAKAQSRKENKEGFSLRLCALARNVFMIVAARNSQGSPARRPPGRRKRSFDPPCR